MKRRALLIACAAVLMGCGGSGGPVVSPVSTFRANHSGDSWTYDVHIDFGIFGAYDGTLSESLSADTYGGNPSVRKTRTFLLQSQQGPKTLTSYIEIAPTGALLAETVNGALVAVTGNTFSVPRTIGLNTTASGTITLANGDTFQETYRVIGAEIVQTPAGFFACWVVAQDVTHSDGTTDAFKFWVAPETGSYVRLTDTTVNSDGTGYTYTASLTASVSALSKGRQVPAGPALSSADTTFCGPSGGQIR